MSMWVFILTIFNYFSEIWSFTVVVILDNSTSGSWDVAACLIKANESLLRAVIDTEG